MKSFSFAVLIVGLLLMGCQDNFELEGKVLDENTQTAIPHRKIIVQALAENNKKFASVYSDEFFTDSTGYFNYSLKKIKNVYVYNFSVVGDSEYAFSNTRLGLTELRGDCRFVSFYINRLADFTMTIERKSKTAYNDTLYVSWESDGINGKMVYPYEIKDYIDRNRKNSSDIEFRWIGGPIESVIKTKVFADKETIVQWELFRNGESKKIRDTIYCLRDVENYAHFRY
jgi:hypothetical protein